MCKLTIGVENENHILDYRQYEVEYFDGDAKFLIVNISAENISS